MRFNLPMPRAPVADGPGVAGAPGAGARPAVRVVTDSTACLPQAHALLGLRDIAVVPLQVLTPHGDRREGIDITAAEVAQRIEAGQRLTTSQPAAEDFAAAYRALAADGAEAIVSVHLSGELSGTVQAAERAAQRSMVPVRVIDSRTTTMALGFAALAAAQCAAAGADGEHVAARAREVAGGSRCLFLVDSLDHLRRGGRLSAGAAALGSALGVRPILDIVDGSVSLAGRVRTRAAAFERLISMAATRAAAMERPHIAVHHLGAPDRAAHAAELLAEVVPDPVVITPVSAVLGAHAGPRVLAIALADLGNHGHEG